MNALTDSQVPSIAELYVEAHESFVDFAGTLSDDDWATSMQCTTRVDSS